MTEQGLIPKNRHWNMTYCYYDKMANECGNGTRHRSHIGRVINDYNIKCLYSLYFRFECIDEQGREYQQPYFANGHQSEATREVVL